MSEFELSWKHQTTWEDEDDIEWAVRIDYDYQPFEPMTKDYPGCYEDATVTAVYKSVAGQWKDCTDESEDAHNSMEIEILESLSQAGLDAMDARGDMLHDQAKEEQADYDEAINRDDNGRDDG